MNLPPRNPNAVVLDNIPNAPGMQEQIAAQQQGAENYSNLATQAPQASVEMMSQMRTADTAGNTAAHAADMALNHHKAEILAKANLTQGAEAMVGLAQRYAPEGGDVATIAQAIRQGLRL